MEIKSCPKCNSDNISICQCLGETIKYGYGIRLYCKDCGFEPPKSKWQWNDSNKAIGVWNKYKRKN